jgi:uncharacterized damage-inducible protein DinB
MGLGAGRTGQIGLMARYNEWMNAKLYEAAASLPPEQVSADRQAFFGSILGTLNHLVVADTVWLKRFAAHPAHYAALDPIRAQPVPARLDQPQAADLPGLRARRAALDRLIVDWAGAIAEPDLDRALDYQNMKGEPLRKNFFSLLMHFFNHQTHHRGQATTLLTQAGVDVGVTDLLSLIPNEDL